MKKTEEGKKRESGKGSIKRRNWGKMKEKKEEKKKSRVEHKGEIGEKK